MFAMKSFIPCKIPITFAIPSDCEVFGSEEIITIQVMNFFFFFYNQEKNLDRYCGYVMVFNKDHNFVVVVYVSMLIAKMRNG